MRSAGPESRSRLVGRLDLTTPASNPRVPNIVLSTTGVFAQGIVRFVYSIIVAATMSAAVLGELNALISLAMLASMLWPTAAAFAATKYVALARGGDDHERAVAVAALLRRRVVTSSLTLAVPVGALAIVVVDDASWFQAAQTVALLVAYSLYTFVRGVIYGVQQVARATLWDVVTALVALIGLSLVTVADEPSVVLLPLVGCYACYAVVNWPKAGRSALDDSHRRELDRFVAYGVVGVLASAGLPQVAMVVAKVATDAEQAGQLAAALSLATPTAMLASAVTLVMSPAIAQMVGREKVSLAQHHTHRATQALIAVMIGLFGSLILLSRLLVDVFYPVGYDEAATLLPLLLVAVLVPTIATAATTFLLVARANGQRIFAAVNVSGFVLGIGAMTVLLARDHDTRSVALGYLFGSGVVGLVPLGIVWRSERRVWGGPSLKIVVGGALIGAGLLAEAHLGSSTSTQILVTLLFLALWAVACLPEIRTAAPLLAGPRSLNASPQSGLDAPSTADPRA